jgi:predicted flap endonuclease-1-like 5' DNA nuclease
MLLSILSNPTTTHLIEIFFWMLGAFLIGLVFGRILTTGNSKNKALHTLSEREQEDLNIVDDVTKIRAKKTFDRGGKEMIQTVPSLIEQDNPLNFNRIGVANFENKDNLQLIKGIGPSIEKKLHKVGIFTFKQISNFNSKDIAKISEMIPTIQGRIERDDWVGEAFKLLQK